MNSIQFTFQFGYFTMKMNEQINRSYYDLHSNLVILLLLIGMPAAISPYTFTFQFGYFTMIFIHTIHLSFNLIYIPIWLFYYFHSSEDFLKARYNLHSNLVILLFNPLKIGEIKENKFTFQFGYFTMCEARQEILCGCGNLHSNLVILLYSLLWTEK